MDVNGFIKAMTQNRENLPEIDYDAEDQRLRSLFRLIDRHGSGMIDFSEFALFLRILSSPDPDFDLAFYYFDKDSDDAITKSEFIDILKSNISEEAENAFLNLDCETMKRFFGSEGNERSLNFYEFTEFFIQFQIEYARQLFLSQDEEGKGYISADSFVNITKLLGDPRAFAYSDYLLSSVSSKKKVTFAEFVGFQKFLQHLPAIKHMLWSTFKKFPNSNIDMNNFRALMRSNAVTTFSPIEAAICFQLFGTNNGTIITAASFREKIINFHMGEE
ncbi:calcium-binding mitochondrial carrier protein-like, partial [Zophobas morio]|uniref:calcium-binding mitochondrial carrier protein-like n=1 Tax=Zophobas morio TaxID=2755281 RepID=UPI003083DD11